MANNSSSNSGVEFNNDKIECALNELGLSVSRLSKYMGISMDKLYKYTLKNKITYNKKECVFRGRDLRSEKSRLDIAKELNLEQELIDYAFYYFNKSNKVIEYNDLYNKIVEERKTTRVIANELGTSCQNVSRIAKNYGLKIHDLVIELREKEKMDLEKSIISDLSKDYTDGLTMAYLEDKYNMNSSKIYKILKNNNLYQERKNLEVDVDKIKMDYLNGKSLVEIAKSMSCSPATIRNRLVADGFIDSGKYRKRKEVKEISKEVLYDMYITKGMKVRDIAKEFGCEPTSIRLRLKQNNITLDKNSGVFGRDNLYDLYVVQGLTGTEIALKLDCDLHTVKNKLNSFGICKTKNH